MAGKILRKEAPYRNEKELGWEDLTRSDLRGTDFTYSELHDDPTRPDGTFKNTTFLYSHFLHADATNLAPDSLDGSSFGLKRRGLLTMKFNPQARIENITFEYDTNTVVGLKIDPNTGYLTCDVDEESLDLLVNNVKALNEKLGIRTSPWRDENKKHHYAETAALEAMMERMSSVLKGNKGIKILGQPEGDKTRAQLPEDHPLLPWARRYVELVEKRDGSAVKNTAAVSEPVASIAEVMAQHDEMDTSRADALLKQVIDLYQEGQIPEGHPLLAVITPEEPTAAPAPAPVL